MEHLKKRIEQLEKRTRIHQAWLVLAGLAIVVLLTLGASNLPGDKQIGRYTLIQGSYRHLAEDKKIVLNISNLFRLDTATGKAWYYHSNMERSGKLNAGWIDAVKIQK